MTSSAELVAQVRQTAAGSPYVVTDQSYGFDRVFAYEVRHDEASQRMTITDVANTVEWNAGLGASPTLRARKSMQKGSVHERSSHQELGVDAETGEVGKVVDYSFNAGEGRDLIRSAAADAGWSEDIGREQKSGLYVGLGVLGALAVVGLVVVAVFIVR